MEEKPILVVKPNLSYAFIAVMLLGIFFIAPVIGFLIGIGYFFIFRTITLTSGIIIYILTLILIMFWQIMNLRVTKYIFYKDKAIFYQGFLTIIKKSVAYKKVTDIHSESSVLGRQFNAGRMKLVTPGEYGQDVGGGFWMHYVNRPDELHDKLEKLVIKKS